MKKLLVICLSVLAALPASSQVETFGVADHLGLSVGAGTTGVTVDLGTMLTDYVGVRVGADIFPTVKVNTELDLDFDADASNYYETYLGKQLPRSVDVQGKPKLSAGHLLVDVHPFKSSFRLTLGAYLGSEDIATVYNKEEGLLRDIYNYNHKAGAFSSLPVNPQPIGLELGDYFLEPDAQGNVDATLRVKSFRPYVGLGFGRAVPKHRVACQFDLGVQFWGSPKVFLRDHELQSSDLDGDSGDALKTISKISVYPSLTLRLVGRLF